MKTLVDNSFRFHQTALNLQAYRQELLASNIANADTPHFKARDVDFKSALQGALAGSRSGVGLETTHAGHISGGAFSAVEGSVKYRAELQSSVDGNTVNMDVERSAFAENALQVEALITFINKRFEGLQRAINGQ